MFHYATGCSEFPTSCKNARTRYKGVNLWFEFTIRERKITIRGGNHDARSRCKNLRSRCIVFTQLRIDISNRVFAPTHRYLSTSQRDRNIAIWRSGTRTHDAKARYCDATSIFFIYLRYICLQKKHCKRKMSVITKSIFNYFS